MNKRHFVLMLLLAMTFFLSGCDRTAKTMEGEGAGKTINPLDPSSMRETFEESKGKINEAVEKQNEATTKALEETGMMEEE